MNKLFTYHIGKKVNIVLYLRNKDFLACNLLSIKCMSEVQGWSHPTMRSIKGLPNPLAAQGHFIDHNSYGNIIFIFNIYINFIFHVKDVIPRQKRLSVRNVNPEDVPSTDKLPHVLPATFKTTDKSMVWSEICYPKIQ